MFMWLYSLLLTMRMGSLSLFHLEGGDGTSDNPCMCMVSAKKCAMMPIGIAIPM